MMNSRKSNYSYMTTAPVGKVVLTMAVPTIICMLVTTLYNMVDTWYVGRISTQATAAVGIVFPIQAIFQACGFFFGQGSGTNISRELGGKNTTDAAKMASTGFFCSLSFGIILMVICLIFLEPLSVALGSTPTILPDTKAFLGIIVIGAPFITASMTMNNQIRFQGKAFYGMFGIISGALLNVITVPIFAFGLGLGIKGAAIGTVIGQITGFCVLLAMTRHGGIIHLSPKNFTLEWSFHKKIIAGGTPSLSRQGLASLSTLCLNLAAGPWGDAAIAGMSIVTRVSAMVFSVIIGLGQGFQPLCGFNYGAGLYDRVREGFWFCIKVAVGFIIPVCAICFIFSAPIIDFLRHDPEVVVVGSAAFRWQIITYPLAVFITVSNMCLQTSGRTIPANLLAACRNGIWFIPALFALSAGFGLLGIEMCQAVADVLSFATAVPLMVHYFRSIRTPRENSL